MPECGRAECGWRKRTAAGEPCRRFTSSCISFRNQLLPLTVTMEIALIVADISAVLVAIRAVMM